MTWRERIVAARERGGFTQDDIRKAGEWGTCAVGETQMAETNDNLLIGLGVRFYAAVLSNSAAWADTTLDNIEDRVLELKRQAP